MRRRVVPAVLLGLFAAAGVAVFLTRPDAVVGATKSWQGLALMAGTGVAALAILLLVRHRTRSLPWALVAAVVPFAVSGWLFVAPAYRTKTLHEALPAGAVAPMPTRTRTGGEMTAGAAPSTRRVFTSTLVGLGHRASGDASLVLLPDGSYVVRFEHADIQNAPDPYVYLVPKRGARSPADGLRLGRLRATRGEFNQPVPRDFHYAGGQLTILVWCRKFATPIAHAT